MTNSERLALLDRIQRLRQRNWLPEPELDIDGIPTDVDPIMVVTVEGIIGEIERAWEELLMDALDAALGVAS